MKKYKTVKEVCQLTGLTRKHLYYFHHEKVVRAVAYANYSVEGYDGYKLYDDEAVEKLQQIALYYQLGFKRDEIRDIMLAPEYDSNRFLDTMLELEKEKHIRATRHIAALEYLKRTGTKNGLVSTLRGITLEELGQTLINLSDSMSQSPHCFDLDAYRKNRFPEELTVLIDLLIHLDQHALTGADCDAIVDRIVELARKNMGDAGIPFLLGLFVSVFGEGEMAQHLSNELTLLHANAVIRYIIEQKKQAENRMEEVT